jgi:hypothetical protein
VESMANSTSCGAFPWDASDFVHLASSTSFLCSYLDSFSSSTCNVVCSYFSVCIYSTSTTIGISLVLPCGPYVLLRVLCLVLLGAPTHGGDMVVKFKWKAINSSCGSEIPHSIILLLDSMFFSLLKITMGRFSPLFLTL